jgi:hypothetical protein
MRPPGSGADGGSPEPAALGPGRLVEAEGGGGRRQHLCFGWAPLATFRCSALALLLIREERGELFSPFFLLKNLKLVYILLEFILSLVKI